MNTLKSSCNSSELAKIGRSSQFPKAELNKITEYAVAPQVTRDFNPLRMARNENVANLKLMSTWGKGQSTAHTRSLHVTHKKTFVQRKPVPTYLK